jgi:DNA-binding response OmpR family regulator
MTNSDAYPQSGAEDHISGTGDSVTSKLLDGLNILVLEDEFLIAMDVEHLCLEHGAKGVAIAGTLAEVPDASAFDAAIVDLMIAGHSTLDFAGELKSRGVPFVFASGYGDHEDLVRRFPGVAVVTKPYAGNDLIEALAAAWRRGREPELA